MCTATADNVLLPSAPVARVNRREAKMHGGSPHGVFKCEGGRQRKAVRTQQPARFGRHPCCVSRGRALKDFHSAGVHKTISRVFFSRRYFEPAPGTNPFLEMFVFFAQRYLFENGTACHNSGFLVQGQVWGTLSSKFGSVACRVPCVTRACAECNAMFFSLKKKQKWPPVQIACDASSSPCKRFFFFLLFIMPFYTFSVF